MLKFTRHQQNTDPVRVIIAVHGIGVHRTDVLSSLKRLFHDSIIVVVDLPGHGENLESNAGGAAWRKFILDLRAHVVAVQKETNLPVILLAESLGVAAIYPLVTDPELDLAGTVLISPPFMLSWRILFSWRSLANLPGIIGIFRSPRFRLDESHLRAARASEEFISARVADPLYASDLNTSLLIQAACSLWRPVLARKRPTAPTLFVFSREDTVVSSLATRLVTRFTNSPHIHLMRHQYSHTWLYETGYVDLLADIQEWMQSTTAG